MLPSWLALAVIAGCGSVGGDADAGARDGGGRDAAPPDGDATTMDGGGPDSGSADAGPAGDCVTLGPFVESEPFADDDHVSHPLPSFASGGWFYVHTMARDGGDRVLYSARPGPDGRLGAWQVATPDHGGGPHGFTAVDVDGTPFHFRNGHIARYPVAADGRLSGDIELIESSPDEAFGGNLYVWDSAAVIDFPGGPSYVFHLGGFSFAGYEYRPDVYRSGVPIGGRFEPTGTEHPGARPGKSAAVAIDLERAFLFTAENGGDRLFRLTVGTDGSAGSFEEAGRLPGSGRGDLVAIGRTLIVVRDATVHAADVGVDGTLGPFREEPSLPVAQIDVSWGDGHLEGAAFGVIGDHLHLTGPTRVYSAPVVRGSPCELP